MRMKWDMSLKKPLAAGAICLVLAAQYVLAQNLGQNPQFNVAVQGQTGSQPEGAFLNFINWVGNVIAPVGAGGAGGHHSLAHRPGLWPMAVCGRGVARGLRRYAID
jgi:hypothetical protein